MIANATTNVTHLMWIGRWVEVKRSDNEGGGWIFKNGRDAADWLMYPPRRDST